MTDYANLLKDAAETAPAQWHSKETAPMDGKWCWASDGESVWIVNGHKDGTLRSASAHAVKFWTRDFIPEPPRTETALKQLIVTKTNVNEQGTEGDSGMNKAG